MQVLGRMGEDILVFVHGASLYQYALPDGGKRLLQSRRAVDDEELRSPQTTKKTALIFSKILLSVGQLADT